MVAADCTGKATFLLDQARRGLSGGRTLLGAGGLASSAARGKAHGQAAGNLNCLKLHLRETLHARVEITGIL